MARFISQLKDFRKAAIEEIDQTKRAISLELFSSVIRDTPVDTGRARGNWQMTVDNPATSSALRLDKQPKGAPPGPELMNELVSGIRGLGHTNYLTNNLPYIVALEYGHSQQGDAMVRKNIARLQQILRETLK